MQADIFTSTKNWKFTKADLLAQERFKQIQQSTRNALPQSFYSVYALTHLQLIKSLPLYNLMRTIPKGVLHHLHFLCCDDSEFHRRYIIDDDRIYLNARCERFQMGTKGQALENGWISMKEGIEKFGRQQWLQKVVGLTCFTKQELESVNYQQKEMWHIFERKIGASIKLLFVKDILQKYTKHLFLKFIRNGYHRIQLRTRIEQLMEYGADGSFIRKANLSEFTGIIDKVYEQVKQQYPQFTVGIIYSGLKVCSDQQLYQDMKEICEMRWPKLLGFDFVQEEDKFDGLQRFDPIVDRLLEEFPQLCHLKKVYHAGQTNCHLTNNIDVAVKAGSVRLGHGLNVLQRPQILPHCKNVCFQINPLSNLILGYFKDIRQGSAHILLGLGYPVSISPDDPGKFGFQDSTVDYFAVAVAYNWTLRHLKLIGYHSINHAICQEDVKTKLINSYETAWNQWVHKFIQHQHIPQQIAHHYQQESKCFDSCGSWTFCEEEEKADKKFKVDKERVIANVCGDLYTDGFLERLQSVQQTSIHKLISQLPKGVLLSCHLHFCHDVNFFKELLLQKINLCVNRSHQSVSSDLPELQLVENWHSIKKLLLEGSYQEIAQQLYQMTSLSHRQLANFATQKQFCKLLNKKKENLLALLRQRRIFELYVRFVLDKLQKQGYQRVQLRVEPIQLIDSQDKTKIYSIHDYFEILDKLIVNFTSKNKPFSVGLIVLCNKKYSFQAISSFLYQISQIKHKFVVGFDFQQQQPQTEYPPLKDYDILLEDFLSKNEELFVSKFYQAGFTNDHSNTNIENALVSGARRILNGINILQRTEILPRCKAVCFEINPIYQFLSRASGGRDFRLSVSSILLGLGVPVSIGSDYGGLIRLQDGNSDLTMALLSYNWSLKHLKLIFLHSIEHAAVASGQKVLIRNAFRRKWDRWIRSYNGLA